MFIVFVIVLSFKHNAFPLLLLYNLIITEKLGSVNFWMTLFVRKSTGSKICSRHRAMKQTTN
jgi:hypothetical protein